MLFYVVLVDWSSTWWYQAYPKRSRAEMFGLEGNSLLQLGERKVITVYQKILTT